MLGHIGYWVRFRIYYVAKFLRPANFRIDGKLRIDFFSLIKFNSQSNINISGNIRLRKSILDLENARLAVTGSVEMDAARVMIKNSEVTIGDGWKMKKVMLSVNNKTSFTAGKYFSMGSDPYYKAGMFLNNATVSLGDNSNIFAHVVCTNSTFSAGDSVFLNAGTQIRCADKITIGNNIFVSYECIIFDSNTHSVKAIDRYQEILDGYPNNAIQTPETKSKIKTAPIVIGNGVWMGTRAIIFKGTHLGDEVIVGAAAVLSGLQVDHHKKVYGNPAIVH